MDAARSAERGQGTGHSRAECWKHSDRGEADDWGVDPPPPSKLYGHSLPVYPAETLIGFECFLSAHSSSRRGRRGTRWFPGPPPTTTLRSGHSDRSGFPHHVGKTDKGFLLNRLRFPGPVSHFASQRSSAACVCDLLGYILHTVLKPSHEVHGLQKGEIAER
jgi:hypothetical protein